MKWYLFLVSMVLCQSGSAFAGNAVSSVAEAGLFPLKAAVVLGEGFHASYDCSQPPHWWFPPGYKEAEDRIKTLIREFLLRRDLPGRAEMAELTYELAFLSIKFDLLFPPLKDCLIHQGCENYINQGCNIIIPLPKKIFLASIYAITVGLHTDFNIKHRRLVPYRDYFVMRDIPISFFETVPLANRQALQRIRQLILSRVPEVLKPRYIMPGQEFVISSQARSAPLTPQQALSSFYLNPDDRKTEDDQILWNGLDQIIDFSFGPQP